MFSMSTRYITWLQREGVPLYKVRDTYWELYSGCLMPASPVPCFLELTHAEAKTLLRDSRAWFLQYASDPSEQEREWWYVICDAYDPKQLSTKIRGEINRGNRSCSVKRVETEWLAEHGYPCYVAAFGRYKNATPVNKDKFRTGILRKIGGPFEHWGVFVGGTLAAYCECIVEDNGVLTSAVKLDPAYLRYYTSYALITSLIEHYVVKHHTVINNGTRPVAHQTNFQDFLQKLGFRRQFCRLNVIYPGWMEKAIQAIFPLRKLISTLPHHGAIYKLRTLLFVEELRRLCR